MGTSQLFLFFSLFFVITVRGDNKCKYPSCSSTGAKVEFPFSLEGENQNPRCGYPGFQLQCNRMNTIQIRLGSSGEFLVRDIDYSLQEIQVYDGKDCLPKRLLNLNLEDTPFKMIEYEEYQFFNCSSNFSSLFFDPITCLSTANTTVYAAPISSGARYLASVCGSPVTVRVPMSSSPFYGYGYSNDYNNNDIHLTWDEPNCTDCAKRGGTCGFKNKEGNEVKCFNIPRQGLTRTVKYVLTIGIGIPTLVSIILITFYLIGRFKTRHSNNHPFHFSNHHDTSSSVLPQPSIFMVGLDNSVIQSYPKTVLGESRRLPKPDDNTCIICLSEYQPKDTLRTIPACKHCFHAACIDEWLRKHVSCPICRKSPLALSSPA